MDLGTIEPAILAWVKAITGQTAVLWMDEPRKAYVGSIVLLEITSTGGYGVDDIASTYDDTPGAETVTRIATGQRWIQLSIHCQSHDQRSGYSARSIAEKARTRARLPGCRQILQAANVSLATVGTAVNTPYKVDGRLVSRYVLDVRLIATSTETDVPVEAIRTVTGTVQVDENTPVPFSTEVG